MTPRRPTASTPTPQGIGDLDLERHLNDPSLKQAFVTPMFDLIAPRYDDFTRYFSFGMDQGWKRALVELGATAIPLRGEVADVATGTGDLALGLARARPDVRVTAVDISPRMLGIARERRDRSGTSNVAVAAGDLAALGLATGSADAVTAGYAVRNAPDWRVAVAELSRVLRPGGHLLTLDFYRPSSLPWRRLFLWWLWTAGRVVGWMWHREPMAYGYIARSIDHFVSWRQFARGLEAAGFRVLAVRRYLGGGVAIHHAVRR